MQDLKLPEHPLDALRDIGYTPRIVGNGGVGLDLGKSNGDDIDLIDIYSKQAVCALEEYGALIVHKSNTFSDIAPMEL